MKTYLEWSKNQIEQVKIQHVLWIKFSFLFVCLCFFLLLEWEEILLIKDKLLKGGLATIFVTTSIFWWYWTMSLIKKLLCFKEKEIIILDELTKDVKSLKQEIISLKSNS